MECNEVFVGWVCNKCRETSLNTFAVKLNINPINKEDKGAGLYFHVCDKCVLRIASNTPHDSFLADIARMVVENREN